VSRRGVEGQGGGESRGGGNTKPAGHVSWPVGHHFTPNRLLQVSGAPPQPYKYPPMVEMRGYTPHFGDSTCKAPILSVVARRSLIGRVVRL
jgi:hypothetical protein